MTEEEAPPPIKSLSEAPDVPLMPPPPTHTARVIGHICASGHTRITHYTEHCPLCITIGLCHKYVEANMAQAVELELLRNERVYLKSRLFDLRDRLIVATDA